MLVLILFLIIFLVANSFIVLEEEVLILMAGVVWLDAAGSFIKGTIETVLEKGGDVIKEKLSGYLSMKLGLVDKKIERCEALLGYIAGIQELRALYMVNYLVVFLDSYLKERIVGYYSVIESSIALYGVSIIVKILNNELALVLKNKN